MKKQENMGIHIGYITSEYPHAKATHAAGIGSSISNLVTALVQKGISVSVFVYGQKKDEVFTENGIRFHLIAHRDFKVFSWYRHRKFLQEYVNKIIVAENIDIIEAPDWTGITAFMKLKVPLVIRFHGSDAYFCKLENRKQKLKNFFFERLAVRNAAAYIAPTRFAGRLSSKIFGIDPRKVKTIHYGLLLQNFENPTPEFFEKGLILYVGTIIRKKGVRELPEILRHVLATFPNAILVMAGADSPDIKTKSPSTWSLMQNQMDTDIRARVQYVGKVPYNEVKQLIMRAHVCVFPTFAETLGMVTIESMAMEKAVVNSNFGWATELIEDGKSGFLCDPSNHVEFAAKIVELMRDDELRSTIGTNARNTVELKFDIDRIVLQNISFYQSLLER